MGRNARPPAEARLAGVQLHGAPQSDSSAQKLGPFTRAQTANICTVQYTVQVKQCGRRSTQSTRSKVPLFCGVRAPVNKARAVNKVSARRVECSRSVQMYARSLCSIRVLCCSVQTSARICKSLAAREWGVQCSHWSATCTRPVVCERVIVRSSFIWKAIAASRIVSSEAELLVTASALFLTTGVRTIACVICSILI